MEIYFFSIDENGIPYAGCKLDNGKRVLGTVWHQYGHYISTGSAVEKNLVRHDFSPEQEKAYQEFLSSGARGKEFFHSPV